MKSRLSLLLLSGTMLALTGMQLFADWTLSQPIDGEDYFPYSDIHVEGFGPTAIAATVKLTRMGVVQDSFGITTNDENGAFSGDFDIGGSWSLGEHSVDIWVGLTQKYGDVQGDVNIDIVDNP